MVNDNAREVALKCLLRVNSDGAYSNIVLNDILKKSKLKPLDKNFATTLFYGVLERKLTLDYIIKQYSKVKFNNITKDILEILRIGIYQLLFMNKVPQSASVNESVKLVKKKSAKGFVNGILRSFIRDGCELKYQGSNNIEELSIKYSCPKDIINLWINAYGKDKTIEILKSLFGRPELIARVNNLKIDINDLKKIFIKENIKVSDVNEVKNALLLENTGTIEELDSFKKGYFHIQDLSSQICCICLSPKKGEKVMDVCAAPGGKTFNLAETMENNGQILAFDLYDEKVKLIRQGANRLGINIINVDKRDSFKAGEKYFNFADKVLCDVPCSGLGIIRRKPEIRYKKISDICDLPSLQYRILEQSSKYLKKSGVLVYSTCTLNPYENGKVADKFLMNHKEFKPYDINLPSFITRNTFEPSNQLTLFPGNYGNDGFFIAAFIRK